MATKIITNMKDMEKVMLESGRQMIKEEINKFVTEWKVHYNGFQTNPIYGNVEKIIDNVTVNIVGRDKLAIGFDVIDNVNEFAQRYSIQNDMENERVYEAFLNDFESYCKENNLPIKRV